MAAPPRPAPGAVGDAARRWCVIVNPTSGRGRGAGCVERLAPLMRAAGLDARFELTRGPMHAAEIAAEAVAAGERRLAAVGGDGTANEMVNGLVSQTSVPLDALTLATLPVGTGNDWARSLRMPADPRRAVALLANGRRVRCDLGRIDYAVPGGRAHRHFVNVAGAGFDACVLERLGARKPGAWAYLRELLAGFRGYRARELALAGGDVALRRRTLVVFAGLGRYCGGGMRTAPGAHLDDGLLDITVIGDMSGLQLLVELRRLFDGSLHDSRHVGAWQATALSIACDDAARAAAATRAGDPMRAGEPTPPGEPVRVEVDGELLGTLPAQVSVLPGALRVVAGPGAAVAG